MTQVVGNPQFAKFLPVDFNNSKGQRTLETAVLVSIVRARRGLIFSPEVGSDLSVSLKALRCGLNREIKSLIPLRPGRRKKERPNRYWHLSFLYRSVN